MEYTVETREYYGGHIKHVRVSQVTALSEYTAILQARKWAVDNWGAKESNIVASIVPPSMEDAYI